jgi:hypothetical protein
LKLATARTGDTERAAVLVPHSDEPVSLMRPDTTIVFSGAVEIRSGDVWRAAGCLFSSC